MHITLLTKGVSKEVGLLAVNELSQLVYCFRSSFFVYQTRLGGLNFKRAEHIAYP